MQYENSCRQTVYSTASAGNRSEEYDSPCCITDGTDGSKPGDHTLAQTFSTMKSPRKQNSNAAGTVRTGIPFTAEIGKEDALPRYPKQPSSEHSSPREIPLPEEESFRTFLNSRLSKHKASQSLKDRIRSSIEHRDM